MKEVDRKGEWNRTVVAVYYTVVVVGLKEVGGVRRTFEERENDAAGGEEELALVDW